MARRKKMLPEGTVVRIPYADGKNAYAQVLDPPWIRVFEGTAQDEVEDVAAIVARPERYRLAITAYPLGDGRWPVVGHSPVLPEDLWIPSRFIQDRWRPEELRIVINTPDGEEIERPATVDECQGLEAYAVWDLPHVEQRLADEDAGVPHLGLLSTRLVGPDEVFTILINRGYAAGAWVVSGRAHADINVGDRVRLGRRGPQLIVAVTAEYSGEGATPDLPTGLSGALHLVGEIPVEAAGNERVLFRCP